MQNDSMDGLKKLYLDEKIEAKLIRPLEKTRNFLTVRDASAGTNVAKAAFLGVRLLR